MGPICPLGNFMVPTGQLLQEGAVENKGDSDVPRPTYGSNRGKVMGIVTFVAVAFSSPQVDYRPCDLSFGNDEPKARFGRLTGQVNCSEMHLDSRGNLNENRSGD
jgi:hypothetical protein